MAEPLTDNPLSANDLLMIIIAIFLPPVAVALRRGIGGAFLLNLLLTLLAYVPGRGAILTPLKAVSREPAPRRLFSALPSRRPEQGPAGLR